MDEYIRTWSSATPQSPLSAASRRSTTKNPSGPFVHVIIPSLIISITLNRALMKMPCVTLRATLCRYMEPCRCFYTCHCSSPVILTPTAVDTQTPTRCRGVQSSTAHVMQHDAIAFRRASTALSPRRSRHRFGSHVAPRPNVFISHPFGPRALDEGLVPPQAHIRPRGGTALSPTQMPALPSRPLGGS
jgi:hypothetical protein